MATTVEDVIAKAEMVEIEPKTGVALKPQLLKEEKVNGTEPKPMNGVKADEDGKNECVPEEKAEAGKEAANGGVPKDEGKKEEVAVEIEPKTGVSFPVKVEDGKQLNAVGLRKKAILGLGIKIYGFGITQSHPYNSYTFFLKKKTFMKDLQLVRYVKQMRHTC